MKDLKILVVTNRSDHEKLRFNCEKENAVIMTANVSHPNSFNRFLGMEFHSVFAIKSEEFSKEEMERFKLLKVRERSII